jgi:hypothetical protein
LDATSRGSVGGTAFTSRLLAALSFRLSAICAKSRKPKA